MVAYVDTGYSSGTIMADRANYWRYYGLQRDPFAAGIRDDEFYLTPRWEQYFDLIHYLCHSSNVLLSITGAKGCGKTTFLRHYLTNFTEAMHTCQLVGSPGLTVTQLSSTLTKEYALPEVITENVEEQLEAQLSALQHHSQECLLVIDNAHRMPDETLSALLYFIRQQSEDQKRLHILLLGELSLRNRLTALAEQADDRSLCHHLVLEPFVLEETKAYLKHRLSAAGLPAAMPLSQANIVRIHSFAEGIPSRVNAVAKQVLIDGMSQRQMNSVMDFIRARQTLFLGGGILLLAMLLVSMLLARGSHYPLNIPSFIATADASDKTDLIVKTVPSDLPILPTPIENDITLTALNDPQVEIVQQPQEVSPPQIVATTDQQTKVLPDVKPIVTQNPEHKTKIIPKIKSNKNYYTLQIMGVSSEESLKKFIAAHHISDQANYIHSYRQGKDWYSLVYGQYASRADAQAAIPSLPNALQQYHPWVRTANAA